MLPTVGNLQTKAGAGFSHDGGIRAKETYSLEFSNWARTAMTEEDVWVTVVGVVRILTVFKGGGEKAFFFFFVKKL